MQSAFIVRLSISQWRARKLDKNATRETKERAGADNKAGVKVYKTLLAADELNAIESIASAAYIEHRKRTVPWSYEGQGAITAEGYPAYKATMATYEKDFHAAVDAFTRAYERDRHDLLSNASNAMRVSLGTLFNPDDYPMVADLKARFTFTVSAEPMPQADDFRVAGLAQEHVEEIKRDIGENNAAALVNANATGWQRVVEHVEKLKLRLEGYKPAAAKGDKVEGKFHDTLIDNIKELATLLPSINVAGDPDLARMAQKLNALTAYTAQDLRESDALRTDIAKQAGVVLADIGQAYKNAA